MIPTDCPLLRVPRTCLIRAVASSAAIVIAIASLSPQSPVVETGFGDKLDHLVAYSMLSLLMAVGWPRWIPFGVVGVIIGFGGLLELLQVLSPGRQPDWADFAVNSLGALTGLAMALLVRRMWAASGRTSMPSAP